MPTNHQSRWTDRVPRISPPLLALLSSITLLLLPTGQQTTTAQLPSGATTTTGQPLTLLQSEGWSVLLALAIPILITSLPLLPMVGTRRRVLAVTTGLLLAFVVLGAASIGRYYLPSAIALAVATWRAPRRPTPEDALT